jgi:hypothetical protein
LAERGIDLVHCDDAAPEDVWGYIFINHNGKYLERLERTGYKGRLFSSFLNRLSSSPTTGFLKPLRYSAVFSWENPGGGSFGQPNDFCSSGRIPFPWRTASSFLGKKKLCVLMAANKWKRRPNELYTERFRAILWFMKHHPKILISSD